jgi:hypothetical protein
VIAVLILLALFFLFIPDLKRLYERITGEQLTNGLAVVGVVFALALLLLLIQTAH